MKVSFEIEISDSAESMKSLTDLIGAQTTANVVASLPDTEPEAVEEEKPKKKAPAKKAPAKKAPAKEEAPEPVEDDIDAALDEMSEEDAREELKKAAIKHKATYGKASLIAKVKKAGGEADGKVKLSAVPADGVVKLIKALQE